METVQTLAWIFAVVFIVVGVLGFVPGITTDGHLLGIFDVSPLHNIVHLASGIVAGIAAAVSGAYAKLYFKVFGVVYGLVTIVGFVQGDTVLGLIPVNMADNILHLVIALVALAIGFGMKGGSTSAAPAPAVEQQDQGGMPQGGGQM